jgi:hypothetical protein
MDPSSGYIDRWRAKLAAVAASAVAVLIAAAIMIFCALWVLTIVVVHALCALAIVVGMVAMAIVFAVCTILGAALSLLFHDPENHHVDQGYHNHPRSLAYGAVAGDERLYNDGRLAFADSF